MKKCLYFLFLLFVVRTDAQTLALLRHDSGTLDNGYILFAPMPSDTIYLINMCDEKVHEWASLYQPGLSVYLLPDGTLLHTGNANNAVFNGGGSGGIIEELDWDSHVKWRYFVSDSTQCQHHDVAYMPNGNILVLAWEEKTVPQLRNAGRDTTKLPPASVGFWSEKIEELHPLDSIHAIVVWEWHLWDHLVQNYDKTKSNYGQVSNPRLLNINFKANKMPDWVHFNSIDYNAKLDQIVISSRNLDEFYIIDHSTTTAEAASHTGGKYGKGGDFLYRWGNAEAYDSVAPLTTHQLFGQHDVHWIPEGMPNAGDILIFDNGNGRIGGNYSTVDRVTLPDSAGTGVYYTPSPTYLPATSTLMYQDSVPASFYMPILGSAQQLINGSILLCGGVKGDFIEADSSQHKVWEYINPVGSTGIMTQNTTPAANSVFRCAFYPDTATCFATHTLLPMGSIEIDPLTYACNSANGLTGLHKPSDDFILFPNPAGEEVHINTQNNDFKVSITDMLGRLYYSASDVKSIDLHNMPAGIYIVSVELKDDIKVYRKLIISR